MGWSFRKSKKVGPIRLTASKRGLSGSVGVRGARISANTRGEVRGTAGIPGSGLYATKRLEEGGGRSQGSAARQLDSESQQITVKDCRGGEGRSLRPGDEGVVTAKVVGLSDSVSDLARVAGLQEGSTGYPRGVREAILFPEGDQIRVILLVYPRDNPLLFDGNPNADIPPQGFINGRLSAADRKKWGPVFAGNKVGALAFIDSTPGMAEVQIRFDPKGLRDDASVDSDR